MWWLRILIACAKPEPSTDVDDSATPDSAPDTASLPTWHLDADQDGFGDPDHATHAESAPSGYVADATDCDDSRADVHPGAAETCDRTDQDCDGAIDEDARDPATWYADSDADAYGDPAQSTNACEAPTGFVSDDTDCDDGDPEVYPTAPERCADGVDQDCDGADIRCRPEGSLSLADAETILYGHEAGAGAGWDVRMGGDTNGDGRPELLIWAAYHSSSSEPPPSGVYLVNQPPLGEHDLHELSIRLWGLDEHLNNYGARAIGDIDEDGADEVLIFRDESACILRGPISEDQTASDTDSCLLNSEDAGVFDDAVPAGDQNGDGLHDFFLSGGSNIRQSGRTYRNVGRAYLFHGPATAALDVEDANAKLTPSLSNEWGQFGQSMCSGDFDGDGVQDVGIGAPGLPYSSVPAWMRGGAVFVLYGPVSGVLTMDDGLGALVDADAAWIHNTRYALAGTSVSCSGDSNDDGKHDLLIGASDGGGAGGAAYLLFEPGFGVRTLDLADWTASGQTDEFGLGASVTIQSDMDGDGLFDVAASASSADYTGIINVWYGGALSGATSTSSADARLLGAQSADFSGDRLAGGADVDLDGFFDLIVGAPGIDSAYGEQSGAVFIVYGGGTL